MSDQIWYVVVEGKADGPHTETEIRQWLGSGKINYADLVFKPGLTRWVPLAECKEFERRQGQPSDIRPDQTKPPVPDESMDGWVLLAKHETVDGQSHFIQSGPYTTEQIRERLKTDRLKYDDQVWKKGMDTWRTIAAIAEFERRENRVQEKDVATVISALPPEITNTKPVPTAAPAGDDEITLIEPMGLDLNNGASAQAAASPSPAKAKEASASKVVTAIQKNEFTEFTEEKVADPKAAKKAAKEAKQKEKEKAKLEAKEYLKAQEISKKSSGGDPLLEDAEPPAPGKFKKRRFAIGAAGAALGMALTYAGINTYQETLSEKNALKSAHRHVASEAPPSAPVAPMVAAAPVTVAAATPPPPTPTPVPKKPVSLKITPLKTAVHPQLAFETDLPSGTSIEVAITARAGSILKYPSFRLVKNITVIPGQMPMLDLSSEYLPSGTYTVLAQGGDLSTTAPLTVGVMNNDFQKRLAAFKKVISEQRKAEKNMLNKGLTSANHDFAFLTTAYATARKGNAEAKKKWTALFHNWKKDFEKETKTIKAVNDNSRNRFVYPDQLLRLKEAQRKLMEVGLNFDKSLKTGRAIASTNNESEVQLKSLLKDLKGQLRALK